LAARPGDPALLYEAGSGGFAQSHNFGDSWEAADEGMSLRYVCGLAVDAEEPSLVYASAASGSGRAHGTGFSNVAIYRRVADGQWEPVMEGLAAFPYALCSDPEPPSQRERGIGMGGVSLHTGRASGACGGVRLGAARNDRMPAPLKAP
jgi:hypothetical protein